MNRASWYLRRHEVREAYPSRADRGLPHHPDGSGFATCPNCHGVGALDYPHWVPEACTSRPCLVCGCSGLIADGFRDPLLRLRTARARRRRDPQAYAHLRHVCAASRHALRLMEACVGMSLACDRAVLAWRNVA